MTLVNSVGVAGEVVVVAGAGERGEPRGSRTGGGAAGFAFEDGSAVPPPSWIPDLQGDDSGPPTPRIGVRLSAPRPVLWPWSGWVDVEILAVAPLPMAQSSNQQRQQQEAGGIPPHRWDDEAALRKVSGTLVFYVVTPVLPAKRAWLRSLAGGPPCSGGIGCATALESGNGSSSSGGAFTAGSPPQQQHLFQRRPESQSSLGVWSLAPAHRWSSDGRSIISRVVIPVSASVAVTPPPRSLTLLWDLGHQGVYPTVRAPFDDVGEGGADPAASQVDW